LRLESFLRSQIVWFYLQDAFEQFNALVNVWRQARIPQQERGVIGLFAYRPFEQRESIRFSPLRNQRLDLSEKDFC